MIGMDSVLESYVREMRSRQLEKLPERFYEEAGALISRLQRDIENMLATGVERALVDEARRKLDNLKNYLGELSKLRHRKIIGILLHNVMAGELERTHENMTPEEKEWYRKLVDATKEHIQKIRAAMEGARAVAEDIVVVSSGAPPPLRHFTRAVIGIPRSAGRGGEDVIVGGAQ